MPCLYRPRNPKSSKFYQILSGYYEEFLRVYQERFQQQYGYFRGVIAEVVSKYLACGDLTHGFAHLRCDKCHHEYLLAFSCKGRYFCPSCHQKRTLILEEFLTSQVLANVGHSQIVFSIPKILRRYFLYDMTVLS